MSELVRPGALANRFGPRLINCRIDETQFAIAVDGPVMTVGGFELVSSLSAISGFHYPALQEIAAELKGHWICGQQAAEQAQISVEESRSGATLKIDPGPMGMYTSLLLLETISGMTLKALFDSSFQLFAEPGMFPEDDYLLALYVQPGRGHHGGHEEHRDHHNGGHEGGGNDDDDHYRDHKDDKKSDPHHEGHH